jgi:RNA polymerase sigma factor (sigma-70 family)
MKLVSQLSTPTPELLAVISDRDLLDAWTTVRHAASLAAIVDRYKVMVLSVCRRRCRSEADAEDAFQTTFLYLARNAHKIRHPERLPGWLHRVAQRAAVATLKSIHQETEPMIDPPADTTDPLDRLTQRHEAIVLDEELADLPEHYRSAIVMHLYEDRPIESLANHFETTVGSIRGRLQRGKQLLAQRLRRRGIVPVLAFAAANAWTVSNTQASESSHAFDDAIDNGTLPDSPIDVTLLETLLAQGIRLMPTQPLAF